MGRAIGDVLPLAIGVAISPVPIIAIILMLGTPRARSTVTAGKALGIGVLLSGLNPKNLALTIAAATVIAQAEISGGQAAVALAVFILIGSVTILAPLGIYFALGAEAKRILDGLKTWMADHNAAIMTVLLLVLGGKLVGEGIGGLSS